MIHDHSHKHRMENINTQDRKEENFHTLLSSITDGYYEVDLAGKIIRINNSMSRILGYETDIILGTSYRAFCTAEVGEEIFQAYNRVYLNGEAISFLEGQFKKSDGSPFCFELSISPMHNEQKVISGFRGIIRDITERKMAEENILIRNRQLIFLNTVAEAANHALELNELMVILKELFGQNLKIPAGTILMYNDSLKCLTPQIYWGLDAGLLDKLDSIPISFLIEGQVFMDQNTPFETDVARFNYMKDNSPLGYCHVCIPLQGKNEFQGAIHLYSSQADEFMEYQRDFFRALGQMIGIAIQKIRLFEEVQSGQEQMRTLSRKLMETQEAERLRLSRELHDEVGQTLTALKINLQVLQRSQISLAEPLQQSINIINHTLQEIRQLSLDLRPSLLDDLGLVAALRWHVDYHSRLSGLEAQFITNLPEVRLPLPLETTCYRIVQEAFTNVVRHSQASHIQVELIYQNSKVHLFVRDDGIGFNIKEATLDAMWGKSLGILGMKERIALVGGEIEINSLANRGTEIHAIFDWQPWPEEGAPI